jgi:hypothetical protein
MKTNRTTELVLVALIFAINHSWAMDVSINSSGNQVILSWPVASTNDFYLQTSTNISNHLAWSNTADPTTNGNTLVITNVATSTDSFYRLQAWEVLFDGTNTSAFRSGSSTLFPSNSWYVPMQPTYAQRSCDPLLS